MNCTNEEAILVLEKWLDDRSPLLLNLQAASNPEMISFTGRILKLVNDGFLFAGISCNITIPLKSATFEYDEVLCGKSVASEKQSGTSPRLRLYFPLGTPTRRKNDVAGVTSSVLSITEVLR
jgi:hypothetical protein